MARQPFNPKKMDRTQAVLHVAVPQLITFMIVQGYPPTFDLYQQTSGYKETVDNLQMTHDDVDSFREIWDYHLNGLMKDHYTREVMRHGLT